MRRALALVTAAADGAGDEEVTPMEIAGELQAALAAPALAGRPAVRRLLQEALDAVSDGLAPDDVATILQAVLAAAGPA